MSLPHSFALLNSEFGAFLYAPIGEERNGMPLSVVSALTRLDIDPWQEAVRLAGLRREEAVSALAQIIDRLPEAQARVLGRPGHRRAIGGAAARRHRSAGAQRTPAAGPQGLPHLRDAERDRAAGDVGDAGGHDRPCDLADLELMLRLYRQIDALLNPAGDRQ